MIMEFVSGGELFEYIVKHGKVRGSSLWDRLFLPAENLKDKLNPSIFPARNLVFNKVIRYFEHDESYYINITRKQILICF